MGPAASAYAALRSSARLIARATAAKEPRLVHRAIRGTQAAARAVTKEDVARFFGECVGTEDGLGAMEHLRAAAEHAPGVPDPVPPKDDDAMETDEKKPAEAEKKAEDKPIETSACLPELTVFCYVVACTILCDAKKYDAALPIVEAASNLAQSFNRRTLDLLGARLFKLWGLAAEKSGGSASLAALRPKMLAHHRTCTVRHDIPGQEVLLNMLLRSYLAERLYAQAERLRSRAPLPEDAIGARSNAQQARYLHYLGRIRAVHLEYTEAKECLTQALRKAPARAAPGFRMLTTKWLVVVRLLLGETPERRELAGVAALQPYFALVAAAREGSLAAFGRVVELHGKTYARDGLAHLVQRLRRNVIRAGVRRVATAYSRISLVDVAAKIGLGDAAPAEVASVVAKVLRDGGEGLEGACLDAASNCLVSRGAPPVYATRAPAAAFDERSLYLMEVHNAALRAMRYPPKRGDAAEGEEARRERLAAERELADALAEDDEEEW